MILHSTALMALIYYRASCFFNDAKSYSTSTVAILAWFLVFASELLLSFIWTLGQAFRWRPTTRTVFPESLPEDTELPAIDVLICTTDPEKEPTLEVMNTVLSAMALDYPAEKLNVYLSDDGGSSLTLYAMREAGAFASSWVPFCKDYNVKTRYPEGYFTAPKEDDSDIRGIEFREARQKVQEKYNVFEEGVERAMEKVRTEESRRTNAQGQPALIEVIQENTVSKDGVCMPRLVYVSREKSLSHPHHFKAGALNVLLRVSGMMSNSPYVLVLDCDMYCSDPTSARQAMCFHLDRSLSPSLSFVQFPQKFRNISKNDIYDSRLRNFFTTQWHGMDGLRGPILSGTCFYMRREALYGSPPIQSRKRLYADIMEHRDTFGPSDEFIKSICGNCKCSEINEDDCKKTVIEEARSLASCTYEEHTKWGEKVGFLYYSVVEDYFTGFNLHCEGWNSVYCDPTSPAFLGSGTTNLNDMLIQVTRWSAGLVDVGISRFCPIIYGSLRMSLLQSMCYAEVALFPLYCLPVWCFATIPQLCLLNGISLYPKVSDLWFIIFSFIFVSSITKHLCEVLLAGGSFKTWRNEQRLWMMKSVTCHLHGSIDAIMKKTGIKETSFIPTNKVTDEEQIKRYEMGVFDFQTSNRLLLPLVTLAILNMICFVGGIARVIKDGIWDEMFVQVFLSFFGLLMNYPIIEGMVLRKDKGCIRPYATVLSVVCAVMFLAIGSTVLKV